MSRISIMEQVQIEHVPADYQVFLALFRDVSNAAFLQAQLVARNREFEYAFIDASTVVSRNHVLAAVFRGIASQLDGTLRTPNVHSEIVTSLNPSSNIAEAYRRFGVTAGTKDLVIVKVLLPQTPVTDPVTDRVIAFSKDDIWKHLRQHVQGNHMLFSDENVKPCTSLDRVKKYYKLNGALGLPAVYDEAATLAEMENLVLGSMALRGL